MSDGITEIDLTQARECLLDLVHRKGKLTGCTSYVQRRMQIGYNRAAAILETLVDQKFITEADAKGERHFR